MVHPGPSSIPCSLTCCTGTVTTPGDELSHSGSRFRLSTTTCLPLKIARAFSLQTPVKVWQVDMLCNTELFCAGSGSISESSSTSGDQEGDNLASQQLYLNHGLRYQPMPPVMAQPPRHIQVRGIVFVIFWVLFG